MNRKSFSFAHSNQNIVRMKKFALPMLLSLGLAFNAHAQTVISYANIFPSGCNLFFPARNVGGLDHTATVGQVFYDQTNGAISLPVVVPQFGNMPKVTRFAISYNFIANHTYTVSLLAKGTVFGRDPLVYGEATSTITPTTNCNGPENDPNSAQTGQTGFIGNNSFQNYNIQIQVLSGGASYLQLKAIGGGTQGDATLMIKQITITDITPPPGPTFSISSSVASRTCGSPSLSGITFTVNSQNATNITGYDYIVSPNQWTYGFPATLVLNPIHLTSNTITLTPFECEGGATLTVVPYINNVAKPSVSKTIAINRPTFSIDGPSSLASVAGAYNFVGSPVCGGGPVWSIDNTNLAELSFSGNTAGVQRRSGFGVPASGTVVLKATVNQCGLGVVATKTISITSPFGFASSPSYLSDAATNVTISPNPGTGMFKVTFGKFIESGSYEIRSLDGKLVNKGTIQKAAMTSVDITNAASGIYFMNVNDGTTQSQHKFVKK